MGITGFNKRRREQEEKLRMELEFQKLVELAIEEKKLKEEAVEENKTYDIIINDIVSETCTLEDIKPTKNKKGK